MFGHTMRFPAINPDLIGELHSQACAPLDHIPTISNFELFPRGRHGVAWIAEIIVDSV
jgi:hypothetical protein